MAKFPWLAATCTGVWPSSVVKFGLAPDLSNMSAHLSPSATLAAM